MCSVTTNVNHKDYAVSVTQCVQLKAELTQRIYKPLEVHINKLYYILFFYIPGMLTIVNCTTAAEQTISLPLLQCSAILSLT
jgi:hypothetical protein